MTYKDPPLNQNKQQKRKIPNSRGDAQGLLLTQLLVKPPCCDISIVPQTALRGQGHSDIDGAIHHHRCPITAEQVHTDGCDGGQVIPGTVSWKEEARPSPARRTWGCRNNPLRKTKRYSTYWVEPPLFRGSVNIRNPQPHNLTRKFKPTFYQETGLDSSSCLEGIY